MATEKKTTIWSKNFICVMAANCLLQMSHSSVNTLVSTYATFLGAGAKVMGLLTGMFYGIALAMRPAAGPITTRVDNRKLMLGVYALGCFVNTGYALFHSIPMFVFFRVFHGIQYAFVGSLCMTIAADSLPMDKMASGLGIFGVGSSVATSIAPQLGIKLRTWGTALRGEDFGFTVVFAFAAVMLALALIPVSMLRPDNKTKETLATTGKWYANIISKPTILPAAVMMLVVMSYSLFSGYLVPFSVETGIENIGVFFTVLALVLICSRPLCGKLTDRLGLRPLLYPGVLLFAATFLLIGTAKSLSVILTAAVVGGIGYGAAYPAIQSLCMQMEPRSRRAVASNTLYTGLDIGFFMGPVLGGFVKDYATYRTVFLVGMVPALLAIVVFTFGWPACSRRLAQTRGQAK